MPVGKARASAHLTDRQATGMVDAWWTDRVLDPANAPRTRVDWLARALREYAALTTTQRATFAAAMPLLEDADEAKTPRSWNVDANARAAVDETEQIDIANQAVALVLVVRPRSELHSTVPEPWAVSLRGGICPRIPDSDPSGAPWNVP